MQRKRRITLRTVFIRADVERSPLSDTASFQVCNRQRLLIQSDANPRSSEHVCDPSHVRNVESLCGTVTQQPSDGQLRKKVARYGIRKKENNLRRSPPIARPPVPSFFSPRSSITHAVFHGLRIRTDRVEQPSFPDSKRRNSNSIDRDSRRDSM